MRLTPSMAKGVAVSGPMLAIMVLVGGCGGGTTTTTGAPTPRPTPSGPTPRPTPSGPTPPPTPAPTKDTGCRPDQAQCESCKAGACETCKTNYKLNGDKKCVAECIGSPALKVPDKPTSPFALNGKAWPAMCIDKTDASFYGIGDWGGDASGGHTWLNPGKCVGYLSGNETVGDTRQCTDADHFAQKYVANQMIQRVPKLDPDYILSAGDNFYPGGYTRICGSSGTSSDDTSNQFANIWEQVYNWDKFADRPWMSVLGNHDYGGRGHNQGWDLQIFFTWSGKPWVMPAQYWSRLVQYRDFAVQYYFLDSNTFDAGGDPDHMICQGGGDCWNFTDAECSKELDKVWEEGLVMMENILKVSTAEWQIVVSHFTGPALASRLKLRELHEHYKIDLLFTGHEHEQHIGTIANTDLEYIISGGGGGVTTDTNSGKADNGYGFVHFEINRTQMTAYMWNWDGYLYRQKTYKARHRKVLKEIVI